MRTETEVRADLESLQKPVERIWPPMTHAEREAVLAWTRANPGLSQRFDELKIELEGIATEERRIASEREKEKYWREGLFRVGLGERIVDVVCNSPAPTPAIDAAREWLESGKTWLMLAGDVGTGKSVAAGFALRHELARGRPSFVDHSVRNRPQGTGAFRRASAVVRMSAFDEGAEELKRLKSVAMLVIDDLGTEHATSWGTSLIHEIFDTRHDDRLHTIITTNIKRDQLKAALGDRLADRIAQDGKVVFLEGKSMRRTGT